MALATNSTPGSIVLAGDLTGVANAPELRVTGVVPGSYGPANIVVDSKGRLVYAKNAMQDLADVESVIGVGTNNSLGLASFCDGFTVTNGVADVSYSDAATDTFGFMQLGSGLTIDNEFTRLVYADADNFGVVKTSTGLASIGGEVSTEIASDTTLGSIKVGTGGIDLSLDTITPKVASDIQKGVFQINMSTMTINSGELDINITGIAATNDAYGLVNSNDANNINISSGMMNVGNNIPQIDAANVFTKAQNTPTNASSGITVDLNLYNNYKPQAGYSYQYNLPTNAQNGDTFRIIGTKSYTNSWSIESFTTSPIIDVAWNGSIYVAITNSGNKCWTSPDALNWTERTLSTSGNWSSIATNGSIFVIGDRDSWRVVTSTNGTSWTTRELENYTYCRKIIWSGTMFLLIGGTTANPTRDTYSSADGVSWSRHLNSLPVSAEWRDVVYGNGTYLIVNRNTAGSCWSSTNGISWTERTLGTASTMYSVGYNAVLNTFIVFTDSATTTPAHFVSTNNGVTWSAVQYAVTSHNGQVHGLFVDGTTTYMIKDTSLYKSTTLATNSWTSVFTGTSMSTYGRGMANTTTTIATKATLGVWIKTPRTTYTATLASGYKTKGTLPAAGPGSAAYVIDCIVYDGNTYCEYL